MSESTLPKDSASVTEDEEVEVPISANTRLHPPFPFGSRTKQQALPTTFLPMSDRIILVFLAICAISFGALSYYLYQDMDKVVNVDVRYDHVHKYQVIPGASGSVNHEIKEFFAQNTDPSRSTENVTSRQGSRTIINFTLPGTLDPPVYLQYRLVGFYQNFRRYWESISNYQQLGIDVTDVDLFKCRPFRSPGENVPKNAHNDEEIIINGVNKHFSDLFYNPCGLIPWSKFNDSFTLRRLPASSINDSLAHSGASWPFTIGEQYTSTLKSVGTAPGVPTDGQLLCNGSDFDAKSNRITLPAASNPCRKQGIAWADDLDRRFVDLKGSASEWTGGGTFPGSTNNIYLQNGWYHNEPGHEVPQPRDEDLLTWLRNGPLPDFSMMYRALDDTELPHSESYNDKEVPVVYQVVVDEFFDVTSFGGEKHFVMWAKGKGGGSFDRQGKANWILFYLYASISGIAAILYVIISVALSVGWLAKKEVPKSISAQFEGLTPTVLAQLALASGSLEGEVSDTESIASRAAAFFNMEPSTTLEEAMMPNSYEVRNYIRMAATRRLKRAGHASRLEEYEAELLRRHGDFHEAPAPEGAEATKSVAE